MAELFIFSQNDEPLTLLTEDTGLVSAPVRIEVNSVPDTPFSFTVEADTENARHVKEENKVVYRDHEGDLRLVVIKELDDSDSIDSPLTTATCEPEFMELQENIIVDRRFTDRTAQFMLDAALENTRYVGEVEVDLGLGSTNFYYLTSVEAIWKIIEVMGGEIKDVVEFDEENNIIARKIKILQRLGKDIGQRFEIDHNITEISRTVLSYPKTAMYGRGASLEIEDDQGEHTGGYTRYIDFADVEWRVSRGNPVDKPRGQRWVGDPDALQVYGRPHNGGKLHRYGIFSNQDYEDPADLLWATWENLQQNKRPEVNYRLSVDLFEDKVSLGDTAIAIDRYFARPIEIQARIIAMEYDLLDIDGTMIVEMGQFLDLEDNRLDEVINEVERIRSRPARVTEGSFPDRMPPVPANVRAEDGYNDIQLYWDFPDVIHIKQFEVYGSQVQGFVPDTQHLLGRTITAAFHHRATVDQKWYFRIRAVNHHGRASDYSPEVSGSTLRIITDDILFGENVAEMLRRDMLIAEMIADDSITWDMVSDAAKDRIEQETRQYTNEEITLVENYLMNQIADKAGFDYVDGQLQLKADQATVNDQISTVMQELADKASLTYVDGQLVDKVNVGTVYTISEIDNKFDNVVSLTRYTTDMDGVVTELESHETRIYQTEQGLGSKVEQTTFNQLVDDVGNIGSELSQAKTSIEQNATSIESKAEQSTVNSLSGEVSDLSSTVIQHAGLIEQKVDSTTYQADQNGVITRFESVESVQSQHADQINQRVTATYVNNAIDGIQIGGRNLITKDSVSRSSAVTSEYKHTLTKTSSSGNPYVRIPHTLFENNTEYVVTFKVKKISGNVYRLAGHSTLAVHNSVRLFIDGVEQTEKLSSGWSNVGEANYPNDDETHDYEVRFRTQNDVPSVSTPFWYIQPNRPQYDADNFVIEIWDWKLEKGNKRTDWTPAPEDIEGRVSQAETAIDQNATAINLRATKTEVNAIEGRLSQAESTLSVQADEIAAKVDVDGIISSLNLSREGVRIDGALIELNGQTLIRNGIIGQAAIADGAISRAKLGTAVVGTLQVADGAITNAKIASLNADKISAANLAAITANLGSVTGGKITQQSSGRRLEMFDGKIDSYWNNQLSMSFGQYSLDFYNTSANHIGSFGPATHYADSSYRGLALTIEDDFFTIGMRAQGLIRPVFRASTRDMKTVVSGPFNGAVPGSSLELYANRRLVSTDTDYESDMNAVDQPSIIMRQGSDANDMTQYFGGMNRRNNAIWEVRWRNREDGSTQRIEASSNGVYLGGRVTGDSVSTGNIIGSQGNAYYENETGGNSLNDTSALKAAGIRTRTGFTHFYVGTLDNGELRVTSGRGNAPGESVIYRDIRVREVIETSSRVYKTNIKKMTASALEEINKLTIVNFQLIDDLNRGVYDLKTGLVAEDSPFFATDDNKGIRNNKLLSYTVKSVQELSRKSNDHADEINWLKIENQLLRAKVAELEKKIA